MIDLTGYVLIGITTPGPPATEGTHMGTCSHVTYRVQTWDLYRCGQKLHLWHGDWLKGEFEVWSHPCGYVAIAHAPAPQRGVN